MAGPREMGQRPEIPGGTLHASMHVSDMPEGSFSGMCPESQIHGRTDQRVRGTRTMSGGVCEGDPRYRTSTVGGHAREVDSNPLPNGGQGGNFADTGAGREEPLPALLSLLTLTGQALWCPFPSSSSCSFTHGGFHVSFQKAYRLHTSSNSQQKCCLLLWLV